MFYPLKNGWMLLDIDSKELDGMNKNTTATIDISRRIETKPWIFWVISLWYKTKYEYIKPKKKWFLKYNFRTIYSLLHWKKEIELQIFYCVVPMEAKWLLIHNSACFHRYQNHCVSFPFIPSKQSIIEFNQV